MSRLTSDGTRLSFQSDTVKPSLAMVAATRSAPAVVTLAVAADPSLVGTIVTVAGTGWRSLDGSAFRVDVIDDTLVMLGDSDTTGQTSDALPGTLTPVDLIEFCTASLDIVAPAGGDLDTTTVCDDVRSVRSGMPGVSTWAIAGFWDAQDGAQVRARQLYRSRQFVVYTARFQDDSGLLFQANLNTLEVHARVDEAVTLQAGGSITGQTSLLGVPADFAWIIAGLPASPSAPGWIIGGTPALPSPDMIVAGQVGLFAMGA